MKLEDFAGNSVNLLLEARKTLGSSQKVTEWLNTPLPGCDNKTPANMLGTQHGYEALMAHLRSLRKHEE